MSDTDLFFIGLCAGAIIVVIVIVLRAIRNAESLDSFGMPRRKDKR